MANQKKSKTEKSLEQKVQESILKKLFIKVNEDELVIEKVDFVLLVLRDLISLAKSDYDIEKALILAIEENEQYRKISDAKRNELKQSSVEFKIEIDTYRAYLDSVEENKPDAKVLSEVHAALNSEPELLAMRLREIIIDSLSDKITDDLSDSMGVGRWDLIGKYADYIFLIAESESIDQAVDQLRGLMKLSPEEFEQRKESLKEGMMRIASFAGEEIDAVESAIILRDQKAEYFKILSKVKEELGME
jgi:hypothetical protein